MTTQTAAANLSPRISSKTTLRTIIVILAIWTLLLAIGALGNYSDKIRHGESASYAWLLWLWYRSHLIMMTLSCCLYTFLSARPARATSPRALLKLYLALLVAVMPLQMLFLGWLEMSGAGVYASFAAAIVGARAESGFGWFTEFAWFTFTCVAVAGACNWREGRQRERALIRAESDNLQLRLGLEQQRLLALRAQLEPHFLFNALNAISALVRADDARLALAGIGHLGELLRYALQASSQEHVSLARERQFVDDYLALQRMRYGARLQIRIDGDSGCSSGDVPPLLLQPLVENALRHDLDCHDGSSDIRLVFGGSEERLTITISNAAGNGRASNPGLGLGLKHTRARLQSAYGAGAVMRAGLVDGRFLVELDLPRYAQTA